MILSLMFSWTFCRTNPGTASQESPVRNWLVTFRTIGSAPSAMVPAPDIPSAVKAATASTISRD